MALTKVKGLVGLPKQDTYYDKVHTFGHGGVIHSTREAVFYMQDGMWYILKEQPQAGYPVPTSPDDKFLCVGLLKGHHRNSPENFGAIPDNPSFDCLPAINLAIKTGTIILTHKATYHVTDEVIIPSYLHGNLSGATIKAIPKTVSTLWEAKKAVVRFSKFPIGEKNVQVGIIENQVRGIRLEGSLNIDCNDIAEYGFYARLLCAESTLGDIYVYRGLKWGIVMLGCWYFNVGILHANSCAQGISLGHPTEGETSPSGGLAINAVFLPFVGAWSTAKSKGKGYDPISDDFSTNVIGAGVVLGESLSSSIGVLCAEHTQGAGLVTKNAISWSLNSVYFEANSKDFSQGSEPNVSLLSSNENREGHTLTISNLTVGVKDGILIKSNSAEIINVTSLYRYDNAKTFHSDCKAQSFKVEHVNYYVLAGEAYKSPKCLILEPLNVDFIRSGVALDTWGTIGYFIGSGTPQQISVKLPSAPQGLVLSVESDTGNEAVTVTGTDFKYQLKNTRTNGKFYKIQLGSLSTVSAKDCTVMVRSKKGDWYNW